MKTFFNRLKRDEGFTLVELMVVVAIIGLLAAVAIPNFKKYQAKSKTSEAKLQLAALYSAETAWFSDYDYYASCLNFMGFDPSQEKNSRYYAIGFAVSYAATDIATGTNNPLAAAGAPVDCTDAHVTYDGGSTGTAMVYTGSSGVFSWGAGKKLSGLSAAVLAAVVTNYTAWIVTAGTDGGTAFEAGAVGYIDKNRVTSAQADRWSINNQKKLSNQVVGY